MAITQAQVILGEQHFDPADFNALIKSHGVAAVLTRGMVCPCVSRDTGSPDPSCTVCDARGAHYYADPEALFVLATRRLQRVLDRAGVLMPGVASFTFPSTAQVKCYDKFAITTDVIVVDELLEKGEQNPLTTASLEVLRFDTILAIERAEIVTRTPEDGIPYTSAPTELVEGTHFTRSGRNIMWTGAGDALVPDGQTYSVRYRTHAVWVVWAPRNRTEGNKVMPPTYDCKRLDFVTKAQGSE